ncbi:unnamed protein product, partial [Musa acuminata subsp. burmannicoides]
VNVQLLLRSFRGLTLLAGDTLLVQAAFLALQKGTLSHIYLWREAEREREREREREYTSQKHRTDMDCNARSGHQQRDII